MNDNQITTLVQCLNDAVTGEGWALFEVEPGVFEIQRDDDAPNEAIRDDADALAHVRNAASRGVAWCIVALCLHKEEAPERIDRYGNLPAQFWFRSDRDDIARCTLCGGYLALLGGLGPYLYTRCQDCGANHSTDRDEEPADYTNERD